MYVTTPTSIREVRAPAVAGSFYPCDAVELEADVRRYLAGARGTTASPPKAVIAPHAGYVYSGPIAGSAFAPLASLRGRVARVVVMGPAHRVAFSGLALPEAEAFATPLGVLRVDDAARSALLELPRVRASDRAHAGEHSLEVELPFVQVLLGDVTIVPILVGDAADAEAAEALERVWGGPETCVVVSSDLSHYCPYAVAERLDGETARAIERLAPGDIGDEQACGCIGVRALLLVARARGLHAAALDVRSSGDTAGTPDSVVGYGAFAFA
jgi:AmmeMemoRadiSam system protein B